MKKLLFKCALLTLLVGTLLYGGSAAYRRTTAYLNLERTENTEKFRDMPESIDIAVFGASHGMADFKKAPEMAVMFNFALSSQTPVYDLHLMRQYQDRIRPGALVVLTVSPLHPFYLQSEDTFSKLQPRYYRILSPRNIVDVDLWYFLRIRYLPLLAMDVSQIAAAFFKPPEPVLTSEQQSGDQQLDPEEIPAEKERIHRDHIAPEITIFPEESPSMANAYREMLALCRERGWRAVLVTPPYPAAYLDCYTEYDPAFFSTLNRWMDELCRTYGVEWLDYSHDPTFAERYDLYKDIDHLNLEGAAVFNRQFFADVQSLGSWQ